MKITSLQDLEELRREGLRTLRPEGIRIAVGTSTCSIAAGAAEVLAELQKAVEAEGLGATVAAVGCMGCCRREPLVEVRRPDGPAVLYQRMDPGKARELVRDLASGNTSLVNFTCTLSSTIPCVLPKRREFLGMITFSPFLCAFEIRAMTGTALSSDITVFSKTA